MKNMRKVILLGVVASACIIVLSSLASAVEYRTVVEQSNKQILSQETTKDMKTVSEKLTDLLPTLKIGDRIAFVLLILKLLKSIRVILSVIRSYGIPVNIILLKLMITFLRNQNIFIKLLASLVRTVGRIFGVILINILKIIRLPFKFISKSITVLISLIRLLYLSAMLRRGINNFQIKDILDRFSNITT